MSGCVGGGRLGQALALYCDPGVPGDLREGEGVGLGSHLRAHELSPVLNEAVVHAGPLDVHHVGEQANASVVVEGLGLELVGD